jgi:UDP:flavonoid glycosyltransferase YjiC (YdhE family)
MRVLFTSTAGVGHVLPLLPLARAFAHAGVDVSFATAPSWCARLQGEGFRFLPAGLEADVGQERNAVHREAWLGLPPLERRPYAFTARFALIEAPERLAGVRNAASSSEPDLIVHESGDLTAPLVATELGLRSVHHGFGRLVPRVCFERAATVTDPLWRAAGLKPDSLGGVFRDVYVDICPPSLADESPPQDVRVEPLRPVTVGAAGEPPEWLVVLPDRPTVYVTLGTIFNTASLFRLVLTALDGLDCNVVATVGERNDPADFAPVPANAHVERFVPQALILPHCRVAVSHGGSGSMLGALAHGLPLLLLPHAADQFANAAACHAAGAARVLMPADLNAGAVRAAVVELLDDPRYSIRAAQIADEIAAMPTPANLVDVLSTLETTRDHGSATNVSTP